jgi:hypothetical protein
MKKIKFIAGACLIITLMFSCQSRSISIGVVGDQFGSYDAQNTFMIMEKGVNRLSKMSPDIVLHVGDMLESIRNIDDFSDYKENYDKAVGIMNTFDCPWLLAVGDHDVVPATFKALSSDRSRETWFMELIKDSGLPIHENPYYSYDYKGFHFIVLYSMENLHTDPRWGSIFLNKINEDQINWLKEDLESQDQKNGIVVLVHHPHWYVWQNWQPVHDLLKQYPTHAVIAGHYHYDQDESTVDGIRYLVMGCTGGVIKDADKNSSSQEIGMIEIDNKGVKNIQLFDVDDGSELEWTPRISMDRIQALSCMLDNLWQDESLYRKNGHVYAGNNDEPLSLIDLESLTNPIDLPIRISIEASGPQQWLIAQEQVVNDTALFNPGFRAGWANYSTVGNWSTLDPVWQLSVNEQELNELGYLELKIHISFYDTEKRTLEKTQRYYVR